MNSALCIQDKSIVGNKGGVPKGRVVPCWMDKEGDDGKK